MGFLSNLNFGGGNFNSTSTPQTDNETTTSADSSTVQLDGLNSNLSSIGGLSNINTEGGEIRIEQTDQGAIQGALAAVDSSLDLVSNISKKAITAVERSAQSDTKSISSSAIMWGGLAAIAYFASKYIKG